MEFVELLERGLSHIVSVSQLVLESISVFCVVMGLFKTIHFVVRLRLKLRRGEEFPFNQVRIEFGTWLALALEFQLGADILATTVAPSLQELGKLAIVAVVRTFLNYFLGKELEAEMEMEHREREHRLKMAQERGEIPG
ncbi:DUF1622 domain-containing protein [Oscillatoria sp. CS-180]|uniref:DUF1622 domain-containing protein n=1 Tax=Oscillatoria sp. CS-180 TaxID=3021720 RepID=UPI00232F3070|nr:DUF1622 domain-containing protein [Oscillatoria sp. CS-180]MDB9526610.1 DUF1622 domain-containing protein [Oscillatoria sp. CS-180]